VAVLLVETAAIGQLAGKKVCSCSQASMMWLAKAQSLLIRDGLRRLYAFDQETIEVIAFMRENPLARSALLP